MLRSTASLIVPPPTPLDPLPTHPPHPHPAPTAHSDLPSVFKTFEVIRAAATRHGAVARIAREAVEDFAADGCVLLELRTTPKVRCCLGVCVWGGGVREGTA